MPPVQYQGASSAGAFFPGDNNPESSAASMRVRKVPAWECCTFLPSPQSLSDTISQQVHRSIKESPTCQVFFATVPDHRIRFTGGAKMRLCQCGVACKEVENSLVLPGSEPELAASTFPERGYHFVVSLKINRWLQALMQPGTSKGGYCVDWSLDPDDLFEYYCELRGGWRPSRSSTGTIPEVLLGPRYVGFKLSPFKQSTIPCIYPRLQRYEADMAAQCLAETMSVFCYALNTNRADAGKVADMKMLFSPDQYVCSPDDDDVDDRPGVMKLSAKEFLERIKSAPGGYDYLSLLEEKPIYKADSIDINQIARPEVCTSAQFREAVPKQLPWSGHRTDSSVSGRSSQS